MSSRENGWNRVPDGGFKNSGTVAAVGMERGFLYWYAIAEWRERVLLLEGVCVGSITLGWEREGGTGERRSNG